jgi:hypothetical protein
MKRYTLIFFLFCLTILNFSCKQEGVEIRGRHLYADGERFRINGICYSRGGAGSYAEDIALLKEANINTIRTYTVINDIDELNAFEDAEIKIIMHLNENDFEDYVTEFKDHPAILMWEFGNEFNYHPEWFENDINNWYKKLEACATRVKQLDPSRPVTSAHGEVPAIEVLKVCPSVDIWGMNLYRYDNNVPAIYEFAEHSDKAMYISEAGADSYNKKKNKIDEESQALANKKIVRGISEEFNLCVGVTLFEFCDEWWKAGNDSIQNVGISAPNSSGVPYDGSADEEYWGIVRRDRTKKLTFNVVKDLYSNLQNN